MVQAIKGERLLTSQAGVALSSVRVTFEQEGWGQRRFTSIMLEDVTSCRLVHRSSPLWLVLGPLGMIVSLGWRDDPRSITVGFVALVACLVVYVMSRRQVMFIKSPSDSIEAATDSQTFETIEAFLNAIQEAKNERYLLRCSAGVPPIP